MDELVHDGEFDVLEHVVEGYLVIGGIEEPNDRSLLIGIPMNVAECPGLQI